MKPTGIVRKIDELGRVVLPIGSRRKFGIELKDPIEISVNEDKIILTKHVPRCVFCKGDMAVTEVMGKLICRECLEGLRTF